MTRSSSPEHPWAVLMHVLDDDDRTRRAERLMSQVTTWLLVVGAAVLFVTAAVLLITGPKWASAGAGSAGLISVVLTLVRRRSRATAAPAELAERSAGVLAIDEGQVSE